MVDVSEEVNVKDRKLSQLTASESSGLDTWEGFCAPFGHSVTDWFVHKAVGLQVLRNTWQALVRRENQRGVTGYPRAYLFS